MKPRHLLTMLLGSAVFSTAAFAQEIVQLDTVVLEAESDETLDQDGYIAYSGRQAMRIDTPIARLPQAVSVITQDQLEDQAPRTMLEALNYTASATPGNFGFDSRYDSFYLRGFPAYQTGVFRDGLRSFNGLSAWYRNDPYTLEGIAVLKGPASSMFGVSTPGGLVNVVSKRPKDTPYHETRLSYGSYSRVEAAVDFTGPLDPEGDTLYRFVALARDADTFIDGYADDRVLLAPSISFRIGDDQRLLLTAEYAKDRTGAVAYFHFADDLDVTDEPAGDPDYNRFDQEQFRIGYEYTWDISDDTQLRQSYRWTKVRADMRYATRSGTYPDLVPSYWQRYHETAKSHVLDLMVEHHAQTGDFDHTFAIGADYLRGEYDADYGGTALGQAANEALDVPFYAWRKQSQTGVYIADQIERDALTISASARYDWVDTDYSDYNFYTGAIDSGSQKDEAFTARLGVSYEFENGVTPYVNVASSFAPNVAQVFDDVSDLSGSPADPTEALQKEIGVKYQLPDQRTVVTAAYYDIRQDNGMSLVVGGDGRNRGLQYDLTSRGYELEAMSNLENGVSLIASYAHMDVEINEGAPGTEGKQLSGVPDDTLSLFVKYEPQQGALQNLAVMGGMRYIGRSYGNDTNTIENASRTYFDLGLSYDFAAFGYDGTQLQLNVKNLFDREGQTCTGDWCYRDEPRMIDLSLSRRF
ncbi:TonB-dependent siderophore receptor [Paracoccus sp. CPCC 101403]|uniref:TonB-dependent siderophore receptor n=1 Tax=Paracoccus broussonetiae TaxID=3075834 RepID=A0ABU3ECL5_9RHOB|nr:TonB-dependent siderophore receptor [Paracoccus sp. CPCC 101403]MDT1061973.1 TonB-dependent siderophore receptor [Paracoccus sp. CPCC 101403]